MKALFASATAAAVLAIGPAIAADIPLKAPAAPAYYSWSGFYIGALVGAGWGTTEHNFTTGVGPTGSWHISGPLAGGTVGVNWQTGGFVLGVEADGAWADIRGRHRGLGCNTGDCFTDIRSIGTARARLGLPTQNALWYVTGGAAFADTRAGVFNSTDVGTKTRTGWTAGAGAEFRLTDAWSAKAEYLFVDLGDPFQYVTAGSNINTRVKLEETHLVRFGLNYRFGRW